jgi:predicted DNA repair protein MutK
MPYFLSFLTLIGTIAMLWVGGNIISHSLEHIGYQTHAEFMHFLLSTVRLTGFVLWIAQTLLYTCIGFTIGAFMYGVGTMLRR